MRTFEDKLGREWRLTIDAPAIDRVRAAAGVDLGRIPFEEFCTRFANSPVKLFPVLHAAAGPDGGPAGVDVEAFARAMGGDELEAAVDALLDALVDTHPPKIRRTIRARDARQKG